MDAITIEADTLQAERVGSTTSPKCTEPKSHSFVDASALESKTDFQESVTTSRQRALGTVRLRHAATKELVLVPLPSDDPNDPLNWSKTFRYYIAFIVCVAMILCNFLAAGPSVAIEETSIDLLGSDSDASLAKVAFFFTTTSLMQGVGNVFWMPLALKYGRRVVYLTSLAVYTITAVWAGTAQTYADALVARILMGFASGSAECVAPLTISDIFFLHERGTVMSVYTASLNVGASLGIVLSGLVTINLSWRYIYWIMAGPIGILTLLVFFTMPETAYNRSSRDDAESPVGKPETGRPSTGLSQTLYTSEQSFLERLRPVRSILTAEPLVKLSLRPIAMIIIPSVLWASLVMAVTIGFLVAISSNFADAYADIYGFDSWQSGLCFAAGLVGSVFGMFFGGYASDYIADFFTNRNDGIREPEFRLPAITISIVTAPLGLCLYGAGLQFGWHWTIPTLGMGLLNFSIAQATNVSLVYIVDAYRPVAGEAVVTQLAFKSLFGFLLSFYTNPWISAAGYINAFGIMAGISAAVLLMWTLFFVYGKQIRNATAEWKMFKSNVSWYKDRDVGE